MVMEGYNDFSSNTLHPTTIIISTIRPGRKGTTEFDQALEDKPVRDVTGISIICLSFITLFSSFFCHIFFFGVGGI